MAHLIQQEEDSRQSGSMLLAKQAVTWKILNLRFNSTGETYSPNNFSFFLPLLHPSSSKSSIMDINSLADSLATVLGTDAKVAKVAKAEEKKQGKERAKEEEEPQTRENEVETIKEFRPEAWPTLKADTTILKLDLFWPIKAEDMENGSVQNTDGDQKGNFSFKELKPLITFHNLHVLHLSGMMRSYQPIIWETVWMNANLSKVTLEMALEPELRDGKFSHCLPLSTPGQTPN